ncbi:MAG: LysR family transcriptional regulator [Planctomycetota bacterium]|nr:LysR family transcriptional regulator [Planctomycetota bacterium]
MTLDLNRLAGFHLVATSGGYAKAARAADYPITQPALHQQVRKLEAEVGVALLERVGKDLMRPTPAGRELLELVEPFLRDLRRVVARIRANEFDGSLTIQAESLLIRGLLPGWLRALRKRRPAAELHLAEISTVDFAALRAGRVDVLVAHVPEVPDDIASLEVATAYACLVVPADRAPKRGRPKLADLQDLPFLAYPVGTRNHALQGRALAQFEVRPEATMSLDTADAILGFVEAGLGWSLVPTLQPDGPSGRQLAAYPFGRPRVTFPISVLWRRDAPEHPLLDAMIDVASPRSSR